MATLKIIGDGPLFERLKLMVNKLGLENSIFLLGKIEDVRPFLWDSDIFITGNAYLTVLEAWAAGLAVIATREETTSDIIHDQFDGLLVQPRDPQQLASAILEIMTNKIKYGYLIKNGLQTVRQFDTSVICKRLMDIYTVVYEKSKVAK